MQKIDVAGLDAIIQRLKQRGFIVIGPTIKDGAIVYNEVSGHKDLPAGWTDEHNAGSYRLLKREDGAFFGYVVGPQSWKKYLFPPTLTLFTVRRNGKGLEIGDGNNPKPRDGRQEQSKAQTPKYAFLGIRSCELHAIGIHDKIFSNGEFVNAHYKALREQIFLVAVNCGRGGGTCFCTSMNTGPKATKGFDIVLTEITNELGHYFVVETGSERGVELLSKIPHQPAADVDRESAERIVQLAAQEMGRSMETENIKQLLMENLDHPLWDEVGRRCLTCANCTMVCPTCFCSTVEDVTDLTGRQAERRRRWDSCFTMDFSYIHGGSIRPSAKARYRQWLTHKLGNWIDQFGTSGCVGCGRCITWCPVGIDITEEIHALRTNTKAENASTSS
jgi:ferredoxin